MVSSAVMKCLCHDGLSTFRSSAADGAYPDDAAEAAVAAAAADAVDAAVLANALSMVVQTYLCGV